MKKEHKNWFCFKKSRWILAAAAALSLYPGSVFAEENIEVENTAAELSVEEGATPVPEKTETTEISEPQLQEQPTKKEPAETTETTEVTEEKKVQETAETPASTETVIPTEAVTPTKAPEQVKTQRSAEKQEKSVSDDSVETKSSAQIISVDITWGNMGFVYQKGLWNPETHQYGVGTWNPDGDGSSQISISNNGTESVKAFLAYTQADTSYSGSFRSGNGENISEIALSAGDNTSVYLVLAGTPSEEFSNSVLGTVTVTIGGQ